MLTATKPQAIDAADSGSLEFIYAHYYEFCVRVALRVTQDRAYAEDAVQDALIDVWRQRDRFDPGLGSMPGWLAMVCHRRAVDLVRKQQRHPYPAGDVAELLTATAANTPDPETVALNEYNAGHVRAGLAALSTAHRQVLVLAYFYGYSQTEIARATAVPLGTVKTRTLHALKLLRLSLSALQPD